MRRDITPLAVLVLAAMQTAASAQTTTVQSLMDGGYTVAGVTQLPGGAGVFLQKGNALVFCDVAETTPTSPAVATKYCKPVK